MALEDLTTKPAQASSAAEDEDLFDFPVIEMTLEGTRTVERRTVAEASAPAPRPSAPAAPAAPIPQAAPAHASSPLSSAAHAHAPAKSPTPPVHASAPQATAAPASAPKVAAAPVTTPAPAAQSAATNTARARDVAQAADLIDDLETVLEEPIDEPRSRLGRKPAGGIQRVLLNNGSPSMLLVGMLALNLLTFGFFWLTSNNFRDGIDGLRDELLLASHGNTPGPVPPAPVRTGSESATSTPPPEHVNDTAPAPVHDTTPTTQPAHPLEAFEQTTLSLAAQEVKDGEFVAARKRLYRLLALADRIDASLRDDVEARARFLIAQSYEAQAAAKHDNLATPANAAAGETKSDEHSAPTKRGKDH